VASIPIRGGCSLHPVKNRGRSFVKGVDEAPPVFRWTVYTFNKTSPFTEGKSPKWREKLESKSGVESEPKTGGKSHPILILDLGDSSH